MDKKRQECSQDLQTFMIYKKKKVFVHLFYLSKEVLVFREQGDSHPEHVIDISSGAYFSSNSKNPSQLDITAKGKREFRFKVANEEKVREWLNHMANSQHGNLTPEQRSERAREANIIKELKRQKAEAAEREKLQQQQQQQTAPPKPSTPSPSTTTSTTQQPTTLTSSSGNIDRTNFIPVRGTVKGNPMVPRNNKRGDRRLDNVFDENSSTHNNNSPSSQHNLGRSLEIEKNSSTEEEQSSFIKRLKDFKQFGCESIDTPAEFRQRIAAVYNKFEKEKETSENDHFHEIQMDAVFSLSGIIVRCYVTETGGKWNWKVENNPLLPIILDSFEETYLSEPGDQTFVLLCTDVNVLMVRYQADTKKWGLVLADGDEPNIAFATADMLGVTFPWNHVYTTVAGGLPKKVILNIEQQVRPRLPMEPIQQERVQLIVVLFDSISRIVVQLGKCFKSLPRVHALEDIRSFTDNTTIGPLVYDTLIPALIELMMDSFDSWTLFGVHHFWDYVLNCTTEVAVHDHIMLLFNSTVSKIQNTKFIVKEGDNVNVIRSRAFFCFALTYNQLSKWLSILIQNQKQTERFYKSNALWRTSHVEILELLKLLDGIPFHLTGLPPSKEDSEEAMQSWFEKAKEEVALQARAVLEESLAEYGYELPKIELQIETSKQEIEQDFGKEYDELVNKISTTYTEMEPDLIAAKESILSGVENFMNDVVDFFEDESSYF